MTVSIRDYYCYRFQIRPSIFNPILHGKRLFQQFVVDIYIKIESHRLDWMRSHQTELRADLYQGFCDSLEAGERRGATTGKWIVLSRSFIGGPRDMRKWYMDAMALVRKYEKPDIFLTMTCNPNWREIRDNLLQGQTAQDRPNLVVRVFRQCYKRRSISCWNNIYLGGLGHMCMLSSFKKGVCLMLIFFLSWNRGINWHALKNMITSSVLNFCPTLKFPISGCE
jgi:hypothetical protein